MVERDRQVHLYTTDEKLPNYGDWVLAYCNLVGYEECNVDPEVVWYNASSDQWFTKNGEEVACINYWFEIPELK